MFQDTFWQPLPPAVPYSLVSWLTDTGSLTERLVRTGHAFSVEVLHQGLTPAQDDEADLIGVAPGEPVYTRHVALLLDGARVVAARSITQREATPWLDVLERGNRSLGLTLFGENSNIIREAMLYRELLPGHPLFTLAGELDPTRSSRYPARRSNFRLDGQALNVCEIFLPALEAFL